MTIPVFSKIQATNDAVLDRVQLNLSRSLNPIVKLPRTQVQVLKSVALAAGQNVIQHSLGQELTGWTVIRQRAAATFYDNQDSNSTPAKTLLLVASAPVSIDLEVF